MVAIIKKFFLPLGTLTLVWVGFEVQSFLSQPTIAQAQNSGIIPVSLPEKVKVTTKQGKTISGPRLVEINAQTQQIKLQQGGNTESRSIASIESLEFSGKTIIKGGKIVIRGAGKTDSNCSNSENWMLPLSHFQWRDSSKAEVRLTSMPSGKQREIQNINTTQTYILDKIKFVTSSKVTLKTTPCSAEE